MGALGSSPIEALLSREQDHILLSFTISSLRLRFRIMISSRLLKATNKSNYRLLARSASQTASEKVWNVYLSGESWNDGHEFMWRLTGAQDIVRWM